MNRLSAIVALCLFASLGAQAAQVLGVGANRKSIAVTHDRVKFAVDDRICVVQQSIEVVCGVVLKTTSKGAIAKLDTIFDNLNIGDQVRRAGGSRQPAAALLDTAELPRSSEKRRFALTAGIDVGPTFFFPLLHFQTNIVPKFSLGIQPVYFRGSTSDGALTAFGGYVTVNYYSQEYFQGLWLQGGGGVMLFNTSSDSTGSEESATSPAFIATVGYRGNWELGLNVGIAAGVAYIQDPNFANLEVKASGLHPLVMLDFGFTF